MKKFVMLALLGAMSVAAQAVELVYNGGFDIGTRGQDGWTEYSDGGFDLIDFWGVDDPFFATGSAWLGGYTSGTDALSQTTVNFGSLPGTATLCFDALFASSDDPFYDFFYAGFLPSNILVTEDIGAVSAGSLVLKSYAIDVSSLMGTGLQTLVFQVDNDSSLSSSVFIDNVSIKANPVPEPASMVAMGLGLAVLVRRRRK